MTVTFFETIQATGLPCVYSHYEQGREDIRFPYLAYHGNGQNTFGADNTYHWRENQYTLEYYFLEKDEEQEAELEQVLLDAGYLYDKSEDVYIDTEGVFVIYYGIN